MGEVTAITIIASPEFATVDASTADAAYISRLYLRLLARLPEEEGKAYWVAKLEGGMTRTEVATAFTFAPGFSDMERNPTAICFFE